MGSQNLLQPNFQTSGYTALREGWDCPFASILTILSKTTAPMAMTQMIGRVLRQPGGHATSTQALNECYIFCFDQEVKQAVESVRKGLEEEGMSGLTQDVRSVTGEGDDVKVVSVPRATRFQNVKILLPRVLYREESGLTRPLDYERDILGGLIWSQLSYTEREHFTPDDHDRLERTLVSVTMSDHGGQFALPLMRAVRKEEDVSGIDIDFPFMVRQLMEVVPNPWQAVRILEETFKALEARGISHERLYLNRLFLLNEMRRDLAAQIAAASEALFRAKLAAGTIMFRLVSTNDPVLNWELAETLELTVGDSERVLRRRNDDPLERGLFERVYERDFNGLEREVAWYLDDRDAVAWWHRLVAKQDYHLQGWQKYKIYPDFLACLKSDERGRRTFTVLETKGEQLKGNDDTGYKAKLFDILETYYNKSLDAGEVDVSDGDNQMLFKIIMEDSWRDDLVSVVTH
jgi:type III restriction enzyme